MNCGLIINLYICSVKKRYFLYCSYKGTAYHGWQIQPNGVSVQGVLTDALRTVLRDPELNIVGAGRTDTGVHATMMPAHFDADLAGIDIEAFVIRLNSFLPQDIAIQKIVEVKSDAHARFDALSRRYEYHITLYKNVFSTDLAARMYGNLDFDLMNKAAALLKDYRDFTSFSKLHTDVKTNNCDVRHAEWTRQGNEWVFTIEADRFLRNMVRAVVGTLFEVGRGKTSLDKFKKIIESKDRCCAGISAPAQGLFLVDVEYPEEIFISPPIP